MLPFFDWFFKPGPIIQPPKPRLPQLGYTVSQSQYDALKEECNRAQTLIGDQEETISELEKEIAAVELVLTAYNTMGEKNGAVRLAMNARDLLKSDRAIIERLSREQEQLTEQFDNERRTHRESEASLRTQLTDARTALEVAKARANKKKIPAIHPVDEVAD